MTLQQSLRRTWEEGLKHHSSFCVGDAHIVILLDKEGSYRLHRYFPVAGSWEVSVDVESGPFEDVYKHILHEYLDGTI